MISIISYEWRKLVQRKGLLVFLMILLALNGAILFSQITRDGMPSNSEQGSPQQIQKQNDVSHEEFINNVEKQAEDMSESLLFRGSRFNQDDLKKTANVYSNLHGVKIEKDYKDGLKYVTDYRVTDILMFLAVAGIIFDMMLYERTGHLFLLIKPMKNGRGKLIIAKYLVVVTSVLVLVILLFGMNYFMVTGLNLTGCGSASIQSLNGYMSAPYKLSINQYIILFMMFKSMAMIAAGSMMFFVCVLCHNEIYAIVTIATIMGGEISLWLNIENYSWLSPLKQLNFATVMDTSAYFNDYRNFNLFNSAVSSMVAGIAFMGFVSALLLLLSIRLFDKEALAEEKISSFVRTEKNSSDITKVHANLFLCECKKILFMQKGLLLIIILVLVQSYSYYRAPIYIDKIESYYLQYSSELSGPMTEEKTLFLEEEEKRFEKLEEELNQQYERYEKGEINKAVLRYYEKELTPSFSETEGFRKAKEQYDRLVEKNKTYKHIEYIYETGWTKLLGAEGKIADILDLLKLFFILLLAFAGIGPCEKQSAVDILIKSSYSGKKRVTHMKRHICRIYTVCAATITFCFRFMQVDKYYGFPGLESNIQSLAIFSGTNLSLPIGIYLLLEYLIKIAIAVIAGELVFSLSEKFYHGYTVFFIGSLIFLVPTIVLWVYIA